MKHIKLISILLIILIGTSCDPYKRLVKKDSVNYVEKVRLDTILIPVPGDTTFIEIPVGEINMNDFGLIQENNDQKINLKIKDSKLTLRTICKEDSLKIVVANLEKKLTEQTTIYKDKEVIVYKSRKLFIYSFFILLGAVILGIGWIYLKNKAKILGLFK